jgi:hypothetical protein
MTGWAAASSFQPIRGFRALGFAEPRKDNGYRTAVSVPFISAMFPAGSAQVNS